MTKSHFDTAKDSKEKAKNVTFMTKQCLCDVTDSENSQFRDFTFHKTQTPNFLHGNAQFTFLCNPQKSSVNVCLVKILKSAITKKRNCMFFRTGEENF